MHCLIIGKFAMNKNILDGQTVKCNMFYEELCNKYGNENVFYIDTYNWKKNPFKLFLNVIYYFKKSDNIIMLPAHNGVKLFSRLLTFLNSFYKKKIHYIVIGSWLFNLINDNKNVGKSLKKFNNIFVETSKLKANLESIGFTNVSILNNYKKIIPLKDNQLVFNNSKTLKICTFSRVNEKKGISDLIRLLSEINKDKVIIKYDVYGMVENDYKNEFENLINTYKFVSYKGVVDATKSIDIIKKYDLLVFPTKYYTEGIPGTIIDSLASGVPVLYSSWENCEDILHDKENGIKFEFNNISNLKEKLLYCYNNKNTINNMKTNCLKSSYNYCSKEILNPLFNSLEVYNEKR